MFKCLSKFHRQYHITQITIFYQYYRQITNKLYRQMMHFQSSRKQQPSQFYRKQPSNQVRTSSLLFYKPSNSYNPSKHPEESHQLKQDYRASSSAKKSRQSMTYTSQFVCENHPNVLAKFVSVSNEGDGGNYCDKCASLLRDQGFQIKNIKGPVQTCGSLARQKKKQSFVVKATQSTYPYPERQTQISSFLSTLSSTQSQILDVQNQVHQMLISSQQFYGQQIEQINEYFESIVQSLELEKNKCYNHILQERQSAQKETRDLFKRLVEGQQQIRSMITDIEGNLDSVYSISWQNYGLVMDVFRSRVGDVDKVLHQVAIKGISEVQFRKIEFAGVPQSINSLSEIIIQNSYGSSHEAESSLLLTEGSNGSLSSRLQKDNQVSYLPQNSIFQKLKTDPNNQSSFGNQNHPIHLMFSFDAQKMREASYQGANRVPQEAQNLKQNLVYPINHPFRQLDYDDENCIKLRKNNNFDALKSDICRVEGIKEVQQTDVLVLSDDQQPITNHAAYNF